jgi:outer membrane protein assembly factor BamB
LDIQYDPIDYVKICECKVNPPKVAPPPPPTPPVWAKFKSDVKNTGLSRYIGSQTNRLKWRYTTGNYVSSSPSIGSDGTIYVGSHDRNIYAINSNGTLKWSYTTGNIVFSSPSIGSDGTIYFGSGDRNIYAISG